MKPFIDPAFWSDSDVEAQTAGVKLCALWLITNSQTSLLGLCSASVSRFTFETRLPGAALDKTIKGLPRAFKRFGDTIYIRHFIHHQFGSGDKLMKNNFFVSLKSLFAAVKDEELRNAILADYPELIMSESGRALKPLPPPPQAQGGREGGYGKGRKGKAGKKESVRGNKFEPPTLDEWLAKAKEIGYPAGDAEESFHSYSAKGWKVGNTPMEVWRSAIQTCFTRWKINGSKFSVVKPQQELKEV